MLQGARMNPSYKYTYTIFIDIDIIYSEWGRKAFSLPMRGASQKLI